MTDAIGTEIKVGDAIYHFKGKAKYPSEVKINKICYANRNNYRSVEQVKVGNNGSLFSKEFIKKPKILIGAILKGDTIIFKTNGKLTPAIAMETQEDGLLTVTVNDFLFVKYTIDYNVALKIKDGKKNLIGLLRDMI